MYGVLRLPGLQWIRYLGSLSDVVEPFAQRHLATPADYSADPCTKIGRSIVLLLVDTVPVVGRVKTNDVHCLIF